MLFDHYRYLSIVLKRLHVLLTLIIVLLLGSNIFFAKGWYQATNLDKVYVAFPDKTFLARRADESLVRSKYEILSFAKLFVEKAFEHTEYSWQEHLREATNWMDTESARLFVFKVSEAIEDLYKGANATSTVTIDEVKINKHLYPHEVLIYYTINVHLPENMKDIYEEDEAAGGLYFQLEIIERSEENPYGLQIKNLKFLPEREKEKSSTSKENPAKP
ncbi:MAG: hypothetical protein ACYC2U_06375 [Candidatus Amoebophilus sp.]